MEVGSRVRELRKDKKWTLETLAQKTGLSVSYLSLLERGGSGYSAESIDKIAEAFSVSPSLLQAPEVDLSRLTEISELVLALSHLPLEEFEAVRKVILAMRARSS
ncbi:MAG: hypothetical protein CL920_19740 [Deltaproteobacteria bacterium]|nr:hypothetical protein [Deltaproteobacteria bacterium]MBU50922.1 hypothetical protein [Deltaproteobacteria bacterium]